MIELGGKRWWRYLGIACLGVLWAAPVVGQEGPVTFEFSFSNPGARSLALGGAFAALADDATAAFANPAGLGQLLEPEISLEGRAWSYENPFVEGGRASGSPTGLGIDTVDGFRLGTSTSEKTGLSFISAVYPAKRWSFAVYRHTWADFELKSNVNALFGEVDGELERSEDVLATTQVEVINNGLAASFKLTDSLSVGLGLVFYEASMNSFSVEYAHDEEDFFGANPYTPELIDTSYSLKGDKSGVSLHGGFLWRPNAQWSFGAYYREGPELILDVLEVTGPAEDESTPGTIDLETTTPLNLPSVYGAGVAYLTSGGKLALSFEWTHVTYSTITEDLDAEVFDRGQIQIADGDEFHLGMEYILASTRPIIALRLGAWHDPDHGVSHGPEADIFEEAIFRGGKDQIHLTGGLGLVFDKFQIDLGIDLADTVDVASLSFVYRF